MTASLKTVPFLGPQVRMPLAAGAYAVGVAVPGTAETGALEVYDGQGRLVLRYEPESGQVRLGFSSAALSVNATTGDARLEAAGKLTLQAKDVEVIGERSAVMGVRNALGQVGATVFASAGRLMMWGRRVDTRAEREYRQVDHSSTEAKTVSVRAEQLSQQVSKLETVASLVLTKAKDVFSRVEGETRIEARQATWKVAESLWFRSRRTFLRADKDVNIDGEKVNLG